MATLPLADDSGSLWYDEYGDGRPLVFVHGGWMNGRSWRPQIDHFADEFRVVTIDVRGHGNTGATDRTRYSIELFADDLERLLARLEADGTRRDGARDDGAPILCGLSLGSMVVQEFLSRHPDRAAGAILAGAVRSMPPVGLPAGMKPLVSPTPAVSTSLSMAGPRTTFRSLLYSIRATTGGPWLSVDPAVRSTAMDAVGEISSAEFRKVFDALFRYEPPSLTGVSTPTLVVHGEQEAQPVVRQGERIAAAVDDGRHLTLGDAGHLVNQDRPRAFNDIGEKFLGGLAAV
ncbi:alpha/beta fold hydrolase [Halobiforma nitratireducens]|uniref:Alpha/beta hydrolase n=1 Tax=Halobiforma nitratireducens JCM 10879 TaxID=1227454 RepID=M0MD82_9EURY|nr:alpha/beta hydrolase [Halobiforma nitratireducens]EMA42604.1 alpha/beta hydrolase [Halobiforma nitratireducens JCM 10879]